MVRAGFFAACAAHIAAAYPPGSASDRDSRSRLLISLYLDEHQTKRDIASLLAEQRSGELHRWPFAPANELERLMERLELHQAVQGYWARGEQYREGLLVYLKRLDSNA